MKIEDVVHNPRFVTLETFCKSGSPCTQLGDRDSYYIGNGLVVGITQKRFNVENNIRVEYGEAGRFCLSVSAFTSSEFAKLYYKFSDGEPDYGIEEFRENISLFHNLYLGEKFHDAKNKLERIKNQGSFHQEGENRGMNSQGKFVFQYDYIKFDNVTYYFFGKPQKGILQGFTYFLR